MKKMFIRLDDACPRRNLDNWERMEELLTRYDIKPLVGIIPDCKDPDMDIYDEDKDFWNKIVPHWKEKGWKFALHGYQHVFHTEDGGINPVNKRSEFAGVPLETQKDMIRIGVEILRSHDIEPTVFFAPAHTFDINTMLALESESKIRIISDTPAGDCYLNKGFVFVPQQAGRVRELPFRTITYCYHPNIMANEDFIELEKFVTTHTISDFDVETVRRKKSLHDFVLMRLYYMRHTIMTR